jgi:hypothetical protein
MQVSFAVATSQGLSISNTTASGDQTITYSVKLGDGLSFDGGGNIIVDTPSIIGDGLTIDGNQNIKINAPTCGTGTTANQQVTSWNGTSFTCVSGTDWNLTANNSATTANIGDNQTVSFDDGTGLTASHSVNNISYAINDTGVIAGAYNPTRTATTGGFNLNIPQFTVNAQGQLTAAGTTAISVTGGAGITVGGDGTISMPGIATGTPSCTTAGQGLSWTGSAFNCTTAYSWNLQADSANQTTVGSGGTVNFLAGSGLTVAKGAGNNNVTYAVTLKVGGGLAFDGNSNLVLQNCTAGQILKVQANGNWGCSSDIDTINNRVYAKLYTDILLVCMHLTNTNFNWGTSNCHRPGAQYQLNPIDTVVGYWPFESDAHFTQAPAVTLSYDTNCGAGGYACNKLPDRDPTISNNWNYVIAPTGTNDTDPQVTNTSTYNSNLCAFNIWNITTAGFNYDVHCPGTMNFVFITTLSLMAIEPLQ